MAKIPYRTYLSEEEMPRQWYNVRADMKEQPDAYLHPGTHQPLKREELLPIFCDELCDQEMNSTDRYIDIPEEVQEFYKIYRPSPLIRAYNLEKAHGTPRKSTTNSRGTIPPVPISSTPPRRRCITPKNRDSPP